jgi:hypothetical protein
MSQQIIFVSAVTDEFGDYRKRLCAELIAQHVIVRTQEHLPVTGEDTLGKIDSQIADCNAVIHLVGEMPGAPALHLEGLKRKYPEFAERLPALAPSINTGSPALSYTQWEAYLALYHGIKLFIATPTPDAARDATFRREAKLQQAQADHLVRLRALGRHPEISFANADQLMAGILKSAVLELLRAADARLNDQNASRLLDLLDRQEVVESIVDEQQGELRVVCGKDDGGINDLRQRLKDVELPWLSRRERRADFDRMSQAEWRKYLLREGETIGWTPHHLTWPLAEEQLGGLTVAEAHDRFIRALLNRFPEARASGPDALAKLHEHLEAVRERHVIFSDIPDRCPRASDSAELVGRLSQTFKSSPGERFRVIIYVETPAKPRLMERFSQAAVSDLLRDHPSVRKVSLPEVRRDQLLEWASLAENVVEMSANRIMEEVGAVYETAGRTPRPFGLALRSSQPPRSLPMKTLRGGLWDRVRGWSAKT